MQVATGLFSILESNDFKTCNLLFIEEEHNSNANFVIASVMWHCIVKEKGRIILLKCHHSLQHYHHLISKFGVIPQNIDEKLKMVSLNILDYQEKSGDLNVEKLLRCIRNYCEQFENITNYLIIDNFSYIFLLSSFAESVNFTRSCTKLLGSYRNLRMIVCNHVSPVDQELIVISRLFYHLSDFIISTICLKSGFSQDVSGHLRLIRNQLYETTITQYCYKIDDKKITLCPLKN